MKCGFSRHSSKHVMRHPHIIAYKEAFIEETSGCLCIVMEFAEHDLAWKLEDHKQKKHYISEKEIWKTFIQVMAYHRSPED